MITHRLFKLGDFGFFFSVCFSWHVYIYIYVYTYEAEEERTLAMAPKRTVLSGHKSSSRAQASVRSGTMRSPSAKDTRKPLTLARFLALSHKRCQTDDVKLKPVRLFYSAEDLYGRLFIPTGIWLRDGILEYPRVDGWKTITRRKRPGELAIMFGTSMNLDQTRCKGNRSHSAAACSKTQPGPASERCLWDQDMIEVCDDQQLSSFCESGTRLYESPPHPSTYHLNGTHALAGTCTLTSDVYYVKR